MTIKKTFFVVQHDEDEEVVDIHMMSDRDKALEAADEYERRSYRCDVIEGRIIERYPMVDA